MSSPIRVLVVDDHPVVRDGMAAVLGCAPDIRVVGQAADGREACGSFRELLPDVTLMDLAMPVMGGIEAIAEIKKEFPRARFIVLTVYVGDEDIHRAFQAGAQAYLLKKAPMEEIMDAIRAVHRGERRIPPYILSRMEQRVSPCDLTARELEVLQWLAKGKSNEEIAGLLKITLRTVKAHVIAVLAKLGASNRTQAVAIALERGILHLP